MLLAKFSKLTKRLYRTPRILVFVLPFLLVLTFYIVFEYEFEFESLSFRRLYEVEDDSPDRYLVRNPKCYMLSKDPMDRTIRKFVKKKKPRACWSGPLLSYVSRDSTNGSIFIAINSTVAETHKSFACCWAPIARAVPTRPPTGKWDTNIRRGKCKVFEKRVWVPQDVEIVQITCRNRTQSTFYENVHAVINPIKVQKRLDKMRSLENASEPQKNPRKLSVLVLGIDNVSRLNFKRSMPKTESFLRETEWFSFDGYNKMGENTFPNLMAILTGQNVTTSETKCKPKSAFGLDRCPIIWYNFRNANYVTAYGEDAAGLATFNYLKPGFVDAPTDYYLRPYVIASEKLVKKSGMIHYCAGPERSVDRIFNYAVEFARTFIATPYFGFFWTNAATHSELNGASSMDDETLEMFRKMKRAGIFNDTMIIFLSDHGMRWGGIRDTYVGWYEERLPFIHIRLPEWFREENPQSVEALRLNQRRLTSPYDLYETLRDVLARGGGKAESSSGCGTCQTMLLPVPFERGCEDAGITPHWCTCTASETIGTSDETALTGAEKFLEHVENIIKVYRDERGKRLCSQLKLKKIHQVDKILGVRNGDNSANFTLDGYFYSIEVTPGGAKYEFTLRCGEGKNFTVTDDEVSRTNSYDADSRCLDHGQKRYCHCATR